MILGGFMSSGMHSDDDKVPTLRILQDPIEAATLDDELESVIAEIQTRADLDTVKRAASHLSIRGLRVLREWVESRLAATDRNSPDPATERGAEAELSERELEVVKLIALGYSNKQIAARMQVSVKTVETYKARAMEKLKFHNRVELVRYAVGRGWMGTT